MLAPSQYAYKSQLMENKTKGQPEQDSIPWRWLNLSTQAAMELLMVTRTHNMHQRKCHQRGYRDSIHFIWRLERSLVYQHMQPRYVLQLPLIQLDKNPSIAWSCITARRFFCSHQFKQIFKVYFHIKISFCTKLSRRYMFSLVIKHGSANTWSNHWIIMSSTILCKQKNIPL